MTPADSLGDGHELASPSRAKCGRDGTGIALKLFPRDWQGLVQKLLPSSL
jgi:hypothetical protein